MIFLLIIINIKKLLENIKNIIYNEIFYYFF